MASPVYESEYLQSRLRETKAEHARTYGRASEPPSESATQRGLLGRDDVIFADDTSAAIRRVSERQYHSSPMGPSPVGPRKVSHMRNTSNSVSTGSNSRVMGAREVEDHVDKLSKQNFDLKMELYHRREKTEELEKKLEEMQQLRNDNEELLEVNQDLLQELDKREQAIDEAVRRIVQLEDTVRMLEKEREEQQPLTATREAHNPIIELSQPPRRTRRAKRSEDPQRLSVSPEVSSRMTEMSRPEAQKMPSFLSNPDADTRVLRSHFMQGNQQIRPIPSINTLASHGQEDYDSEQERERQDEEALRSPALSVLSESEFKSVYGHDNTSYARSTEDENEEQRAEESSASERSRRARTNRWINDSALSPANLHKPSSRRRSPQPQPFQSLGGVLHEDAPVAQAITPVEQTARPVTKSRSAEETSIAHQYSSNAIFGQNVFPPTPDTMLTQETRPSTQPSNQSSSSIALDRRRDFLVAPSDSYAGRPHDSRNLTSHQQKHNASRNSPLPYQVDTLDSGSETMVNQIPLQSEFGASLQRAESYEADDSHTFQQARKRPSLRRDHSNDIASFDRARPPSSSLNITSLSLQQRQTSPRGRVPMDVYGASIALEEPPMPRRRSVSSDIPTQKAFLETRTLSPQTPQTPRANGERMLKAPSTDSRACRSVSPSQSVQNVPRRSQSQRDSSRSESGHAPRPPPHAAPLTSHPIVATTATTTTPTRSTDNLRQRVSKFGRRNSNTTHATVNPSEAASTASADLHTPPSASRGGASADQELSRTPSIVRRTRQIFHRRRSSATKGAGIKARSPPASPTLPRRGHMRTGSGGAHDEETLTRSRAEGTNAFMEAARAAAPSLITSPVKGLPKEGISTSIPIIPLPQSPSDDPPGVLHARSASTLSSTSHVSMFSRGVTAAPAAEVSKVSAEGKPISPAHDSRRGKSSGTHQGTPTRF